MKFSRLTPFTFLPATTFIVSAWVAGALFYDELPTKIPSHWSVPFRANGYTNKPLGAFLFPLLISGIWLARPLLRWVSRRKPRNERFPGAYDFRMMLTMGLLFVIWSVVMAQSVSWKRVVALPVAIALIVAGGFLATATFRQVHRLGAGRFLAREADWLRARPLTSLLFAVAGVGVLAMVAFSR